MQNLCGFYTIYAVFQLFKFLQKHLSNNHDMHVLQIISNSR